MNVEARVILRMAFTLPFAPAMLFLPAGSLRFWQGWVFLVSVVGTWIGFTFWLLKRDPQLVERRLQMKEKEPEQKLFQRLWSAIFIPAFLLPDFDFRFGWSRAWLGPVPVRLVLAGDAVSLAGSCLIFWAMKTDSFAWPTIQTEEGQTVIATGPYAIVRHPFYAGTLLWIAVMPLALGSYVAVPVFLLLVPVLVYRLIYEEKVLRRDLPGYVDYCWRTRFRLVP